MASIAQEQKSSKYKKSSDSRSTNNKHQHVINMPNAVDSSFFPKVSKNNVMMDSTKDLVVGEKNIQYGAVKDRNPQQDANNQLQQQQKKSFYNDSQLGRFSTISDETSSIMNASVVGINFTKQLAGGPKSGKNKHQKNRVGLDGERENNFDSKGAPRMTDSQKRLLSVKRENMRNFLPAIYNSVNGSPDPRRDGKSPSSSILQRYKQPEFSINNETENSLDNHRTKRTEHHESTQMQTSIEQSQASLPSNLHQQVLRDKNYTTIDEKTQPNHFCSQDDKSYFFADKQNLKKISHQRAISTDMVQQENGTADEGKTMIYSPHGAVSGRQMTNQSQQFILGGAQNLPLDATPAAADSPINNLNPFVNIALSSEVTKWTTDEIPKNSYRYGATNQENTTKEEGYDSPVHSQLNDPNSWIVNQKQNQTKDKSVRDVPVQKKGGDSRVNRNTAQKRYLSSDIFALKQITIEQSRKDIMAEFATSTKKKNFRGKERLLVQSVDLSNYVQKSLRKKQLMFGNIAGKETIRNRETALMQSMQLNKNSHGARTSQILAPKTIDAMAQLASHNKRTKHYIIAPQKKPHEQDDLGVLHRGDSICNTLIGEMPPLGQNRQNLEPILGSKRNNNHNNQNSPKYKIGRQQSSAAGQSQLATSVISLETPTMLKQHTVSQLFQQSDYVDNGNLSNLSSPHLLKHDSTIRGNNAAAMQISDNKSFKLENILPVHNQDYNLTASNAAAINQIQPMLTQISNEKPSSSHLTNKEELGNLIKQGFATMNLGYGAGSGGISQSLLYDAGGHMNHNSSLNEAQMTAEMQFKMRVNTGNGPGGADLLQRNQDVTSDMFTQREMEVLRAKIEKRVELQQRIENETQSRKRMFKPEMDYQKQGPSRLDMEKTTRKTVMKILQDNKQKLRQTRQEMIEVIKQDKQSKQISKHPTSIWQPQYQQNGAERRGDYFSMKSTIKADVTSVNISQSQMVLQPQYSKQLYQSTNKNKRLGAAEQLLASGFDDQVLQSQIFERLSAGKTAFAGQDDIHSQMSFIQNQDTADAYHTSLRKKKLKQNQLTNNKFINSPIHALESLQASVTNIMSTDGSLKTQYDGTKQKKTQADRDKEAANRLMLYQIDQLEQEALCREQDSEKLHDLLKYKMPSNIQVKGNKPKIRDQMQYEQKAHEPTEAEKEQINQQWYQQLANTFINDKDGGRLMTRKSMEDLLKKLTQEQKNQLAANQPMYGEISYDRAINEIFDQKKQEAEGAKGLNEKQANNLSKENQNEIKGMALLMRQELKESEDSIQDKRLTNEIQRYVQTLSQELTGVNLDYKTFYNPRDSQLSSTQKLPVPKPKDFMQRSKNASPMRKEISLKGNGVPLPSWMNLSRQSSESPTRLSKHNHSPLKRGSPLKRSKGMQQWSMMSMDDTPIRIANSKRKISELSIQKMATKRMNQKQAKKYPLQNLSEDQTDEANGLKDIANKLYDLVHFYKVHKNSISQVFTEKYAQDHRLGFFLECFQEMDIILPIFNQIQHDGTMYLKEYLLNSGHARGLRIACTLNPLVFSKVFIDNCGLDEHDMEELFFGFAQLDVTRSIVIRRSTVGPQITPFLTQMMQNIFPNNLSILKIEKCKISKEATLALTQCLTGQKSYIRTLALVGVSFDEESIMEMCKYLKNKPYIEDLDLSDNRISPKLFLPLLEALSKLNTLKNLNISWNLLVELTKGPQIGTVIQEEKLIYGRADEPIILPDFPIVKDSSLVEDPINEIQRSIESTTNLETKQQAQSKQSSSLLLKVDTDEGQPATQQIIEESRIHKLAENLPQLDLGQASSFIRQAKEQTSLSKETSKSVIVNFPNYETQEDFTNYEVEELSEEQEQVIQYLKKILKCVQLQHLDLSDTGLNEGMLLKLSKPIYASSSLLSLHLSGNPGLKDHIIRRIQSKLKATYETPFLKKTFQPIIRMYDNKFGVQRTNSRERRNMRSSILEDIEERDSISSDSLMKDHSEKHMIKPEKLKAQMVYKQLLIEKEAITPVDDAKLSRDHRRHFLLSRILGHELEMPGASEWEIQKDSAQQCWVCDRKQFTFFFWSPEFGEIEQTELDWLEPQDKDKIIKTIFVDRDTSNLREARRGKPQTRLLTPETRTRFDAENKQQREILSEEISDDLSADDTSQTDSILNESDSQQETVQNHQKSQNFKKTGNNFKPKTRTLYHGPVILGAFNNWQAQPLIKVDQLARVLDKRPIPDFLQELKDLKKCRPNLSDVKQMSKQERINYQARVEAHQSSYIHPEVWGPILSQYLRSNYRQSRIVGRENLETIQASTIYVCGAFLDMGKNNYIVSYNNKTYFHETNIGIRREQIPISIKIKENAKLTDRTANVFKFWQKDTPDSIAKVMDLDFTYQKIFSIIKQPVDQEDVRELMLANLSYLKNVYTTLIVNNQNFPYLSISEFNRFCVVCQLPDSTMTQSQLAFLISSVKSKQKNIDHPKIQGQGTADLNRAEFLEIIIRIAIFKYKDNAPKGVFLTIKECVEKVINEKMKPNFTPAPWQTYRDEELWTRKVNLVFFDNAEGLRLLYQKYMNKSVSKVPFNSAIKLLTTDCSIKLNRFDAIYCYGMSLSTCADLYKATFNKLMHQTYEEFLEMIARAAEIHFECSDSEGLDLWEKIMLILDELFTLVEDQVPVIPRWTTEEDDHESEPDTAAQIPLQKLKMMKAANLYTDAVTDQITVQEDVKFFD